MIVKNEEKNIYACLKSASDIVDEIIIVDTGSTDKTIEIAKEFTDKIYSFQWINDFSAARNYSFSLASKEYILWLDADDVLLNEDRTKLIDLKSFLHESIDYVSMYYDITFNNEGKCIFSTIRERLIKNYKGFYWDCFMHERLNVWGNHQHTDIHITHTKCHHDNNRNLENFRSKIKDNYFLNAREMYFYGCELFLGKYYDDAIRVFEEFFTHNYNNTFEQINGLQMLADCYFEKKDFNKALECYIKTFVYDCPKPIILYKVGYLTQLLKRYSEAITWYKILIENYLNTDNFIEDDLKWLTYIPYQQLVICYYNIGDTKNANFYNELAAKIIPDDSSVISNRKFFKDIINEYKGVNE